MALIFLAIKMRRIQRITSDHGWHATLDNGWHITLDHGWHTPHITLDHGWQVHSHTTLDHSASTLDIRMPVPLSPKIVGWPHPDFLAACRSADLLVARSGLYEGVHAYVAHRRAAYLSDNVVLDVP
jgi:hypothetical protein